MGKFWKDVGSFWKDVGSAFVNQSNNYVGVGENTPRSLDVPNPDNPDQAIAFGALGEYAAKVDPTAQRSYVESGYISNVRPRFLETLMQEPDISIVIKKRMFSSLTENYRIDLMDSADRGYLKASKRLLQNKCQVISTYERLTKLERVIESKGVLDDFLTPMLLSGIEALESVGINIVSPKAKSVLDRIRKMQAFSEPELFTTWFVDPDAPFDMGEGIGTFTLTTVASVNTTVSTKLGGGSCTLNIEDPYHLMNITDLDIDRAIADIFNHRQSTALFQFSEQELAKQNNNLKIKLSTERALRGASPIIWKVNDNSVLNKRVRAYIDGEGREIIFTFDPGFGGINSSIEVDPAAMEGKNGLTEGEIKQFEKITKNIYLILNLRRQKEAELSDVLSSDNQKDVDYIRSKMRLQFANKNIIQVMDTVHIFMSSKTMVDNKAIGVNVNTNYGPGNNLLSMLNSTTNKLEQSFNNLTGFFGGAGDTFVEIEKNAIVGPDFPLWLWTAMRNSFTRQAAGVHVFAGIVNKVSSEFSGGKYKLNVNCSDHSEYFKKGKINKKPGPDVPERSIYDPLTPFDLEFDGATGVLVDDHPKLLPENESLLYSGIVKFKNGSKFLGSPMTQFLYLIGSNDNTSSPGFDTMQRVFFDPDGFVYRWKSGIGTFTYTGSRHPKNKYRENVSPSMTSDPWAGQDVMNVLSLLICGKPHNYNTFITSAISTGNFSLNNDAHVNNSEIARSFYRSLISDINIENLTWGNFIPFKKIIMNNNALKFMIQGQFSVQRANAELGRLLAERARIFDALAAVGAEFADNPNIYELDVNGNLGNGNIIINRNNIPSHSVNIAEGDIALNQLLDLDKQIASQQNQLLQALGTANTNDGSFQIFGDDISYSPDYEGVGDQVGEEDREQSRQDLRRKMKYLTQRRLWKVKENSDQNLFIVDDQYDKDYDIQAFERALADKLPFLKSTYASIFEQIQAVAQILNLEVFANTQGHIEVRPPCYNRMPSSVFYRMVSDRRRLFPKTLETLFINQAEGLTDRLKVVEDKMRLRTLALGLGNDSSAQKFLSSSMNNTKIIFSSFSFVFITGEENGEFEKPFTFRALVRQDSPDALESQEYKALKSLEQKIAGQTRLTALFDKGTQLKAVYNKDLLKMPVGDSPIELSYGKVKNRIEMATGEKVQSIWEMQGRTADIRQRIRTQTSTMKLVGELSSLVSERQNIIKLLRNALKNIDQGILINGDPNERRTTLFPNLQRNKSIPSVIQHMIEDEEEDDLGPGSGGRYVIKDNQIISLRIVESEPEFTAIEAIGSVDGGGEGSGLVTSVHQGGIGEDGNMQTSAIAVDYDLWRMYGFKVGSSIKAPYISSAEAQAAPLAVWALTEQRRKLISGDVSIVGNEYMQPGEVVYIEDRDLLFYIETVSHSFTYASGFTTNLTLTFGHNPGEYFPTMLDIVGKGLYSKRNQENKIRNARFGQANGDQYLGTLVVEPQFPLSDPVEALVMKNRYGDQNRATLTQLMMTLKEAQVAGSEEEAFIEVRYYFNDDRGFSANADLKNVAEGVKKWLKNPTKKGFGPANPGGDTLAKVVGAPARALESLRSDKGSLLDDGIIEGLKPSEVDRLITIREVGVKDNVGPSSRAWLISREISGVTDNLGLNDDITNSSKIKRNKKKSKGGSAAQKSQDQARATPEEKALYKSVLDIWVTFKPKPAVKEQSKEISQAALINNAEVAAQKR